MVKLSSFKIILSYILSFFFYNTYAGGDIQRLYAKHLITISENGAYTESIEEILHLKEDKTYEIYFTELQSINNLMISFMNSNGKWEKYRTNKLKVDDVITNNFFEGIKAYRLGFHSGDIVKLSYQKTSMEMHYLSNIMITDGIISDSLVYSYSLPIQYKIEYKIGQIDTLIKIQVDSNNIDQSYTFKIYNPQKVDLCKSFIYLNIHSDSITAAQSLNNWAWNLIKTNKGINDFNYSQLRPKFPIEKDTLAFIDSLFNSIRKKITYVAIENGYGAWRPRAADKIFENKKGDCKDMANLLYQCLQKAGISSWLAMAPTLTAPDNFTFPSGGICNHMICVANVNGKWLYLDATDDASPLNFPSRHTQGRNIFCISDSAPFILSIPIVQAENNKITHTVSIQNNGHNYMGNWEIELNGYNASYFYDVINYHGYSQIQISLENYFNKFGSKCKFTNIQYELKSDHQILVTAQLELNSQLFLKIDTVEFLNLAAVPFPEINNQSKIECRWFNMNTELNQFKFQIETKNSTKLKQEPNIKFNEEGISYELKVNHKEANTILITSSYRNHNIESSPQQHAIINKLNTTIKKSQKTMLELTKAL